MKIRIADSGEIVGWTTPEDQHELTAEERIQFANEIDAAKEAVALQADLPWRLKAIMKAMVKVVNARFPADKKITAQELKQAIKEEL